MDVVTYTQHKRLDVLNYIKPIVSFESYSWVQSLFNDINKKMVVEKDDEFSAKVLSMYQNILDFFQQYVANLNAGSILFTFYMCSLELGVRGYNDSVTTLKEFTDYIDTSNISELNIFINSANIASRKLALQVGYEKVTSVKYKMNK